MKINNILIIVFIALIFISDGSYSIDYLGWAKDRSVLKDTLGYVFRRYPCSATMKNDYIYSQPDESEAYRIGYGESWDRVVVTGENLVSGEKWLSITFDEIMLLKNKDLKSKIIMGNTRNTITLFNTIITTGLFLLIAANNNNNPDRLYAYIQILEWGITGLIIGLAGSNTYINKYNENITEKYTGAIKQVK